MIYSKEVENMCVVAKGPNHGPAPIPEEGKWIQAKEIKDISGYTHGIGWCAPQQGACKLSLNVKDGVIQEARLAALNQQTEGKKPEEISQEVKDDKANTQKAIDEQKDKKQNVINGFAANNEIVHQLIDLALLQNGMLKGEALDKFLQRSVELIK